MTLPSAPSSIAASQIWTEYNMPSGTPMSQWYAGGPYVPAGTTGDNGPIPASGPLKFSDFYGSTNGVVMTLVPATNLNITGYNRGPPAIGSLTPNVFEGTDIEGINFDVNVPNIRVIFLGIRAQDFWTRLIISGGGPTLLSASPTSFDNTGPNTFWFFNSSFAFPDASYTVTMS